MTPIIIPTGNSGPMTEEDVKSFIGVGIILLAIWFIVTITNAIRYFLYYKNDPWYSFWEFIFDGKGSYLTGPYNIVMIVGFGLFLIFWLGNELSKIL